MTSPWLGKSCQLCGSRVARPRSLRCAQCAYVHAPTGSSVVHPSSRYAIDVAAQLFVAAFPDGAAHTDIGAALGCSRERVRQIERGALRSLFKRLPLAGVRAEDVVAHLASKHGDPNTMPTSSSHDIEPRPLKQRPDGTERLPEEGALSEHAARVEGRLDELEAATRKIRARLRRADQETERAA